MLMRILMTGGSGQLGHEFVSALHDRYELVVPGRSECDLSSPDLLRTLVRSVAPDVILNCAAYTNVNGAETDQVTAHAVNAVAPGVLAEEAARCGCLLIHFSTDYVFSGDKAGAYTEEDQPAPLNVYGATKLAGELAVAATGCRHLIFRTSWVYSAHGHNFINTMLQLGRRRETLSVVDDQVGAPTSTLQLTSAVTTVLAQSAAQNSTLLSGVYHLTAGGAVSWCGLARRIFARAAGNTELIVREVLGVSSSEYPSPARRPLNSVLSNQKFQQFFGFQVESWEHGLDAVLAELGLFKQAHTER